MPKNLPTGIAHGSIDCDGRNGVTRRNLFKFGAAGFMGLSMLDLMKATVLSAPADNARCDSVILVWLAGGPSHIDTFDPKPGQETAGPFKPVRTTAAGIELCEHLPNVAKVMKHAALIRSMTNKEGSHERATYQMHTGYAPLGSIAHPPMGSLVVQQKGRRNEEIPAYVHIGGNAAFGAGFLGTQFAPFYIANVSNASKNLVFPAGVDDARFRKRIGLLNAVDKEFSSQKRDTLVTDQGIHYREALKIMYSKAANAFSLDGEKEATLDAYGRNPVGQAAVLARRLVESGVRFVEITMGGWDTHTEIDTNIPGNLSKLDPALGNLIDDLNARGLLKRTMVICTGEFGRTPKVNTRGGRDHYPRCWSSFIAGGGIKSGYCHGSTDAKGTEVKDSPVQPGDLHATLCEAMGIDYAKENISPEGRPIRIVDKGKPVMDLLA